MIGDNSKGITVSMWIWIIAGVVIGVSVFTIAYFNIWQLSAQSHNQEVRDSFLTLRDEIQHACLNAPEYKKPDIPMNMYKARAVYVKEKIGPPDPKVPKLIANRSQSEGRHICLSFSEGEYECSELSCTTKMTYIGKPLKGSDMYELGIEDGNFEFEVTVEKVADSTVEVSAKHVP